LDKLSSEGVATYYGLQNDVKKFINECHCVVLPSYHEGMSNTLLEGAAMGRPLIASNIAGCREAVIDNESGYLVEKANKEDLYQKIKNFISLDLEQKKQQGQKSRELVETHFDREKVNLQTVEKILGV